MLQFHHAEHVGQHFRIPLWCARLRRACLGPVLVRKLYWRARDIVSIEEAYLDAEFYAVGVLWSLSETGSNYVVSARKKAQAMRAAEPVDVRRGC